VKVSSIRITGAFSSPSFVVDTEAESVDSPEPQAAIISRSKTDGRVTVIFRNLLGIL